MYLCRQNLLGQSRCPVRNDNYTYVSAITAEYRGVHGVRERVYPGEEVVLGQGHKAAAPTDGRKRLISVLVLK